MSDDPTANVHSALAAVMGDLPSIGKGGQASQAQGGYSYRGIEQITQHAAPLLAKHGVVFVPQVVSMEFRDLMVNSKPWTDTILTVRYRICGPGGADDYVEAIVVGIGRDNSDKGANKAMTQAFKYALTQVLCIADQKDDNDGTTAEADAHDSEPVPEGFADHTEKSDRYATLRSRLGALSPAEHDAYVAWRDDQGFAFPYPLAVCVAMENELDRVEAESVLAAEERTGEAIDEPRVEVPGDTLPDPVVLDECVAAVAVLTPPQVKRELAEANLAVTGTVKDQRARLAVHLALNAPPKGDA